MNRRELVQRIVLGGSVLVLVPSVLQSCTKDSTTDPVVNPPPTKIELDLTLPANAALNNNGGSIIVQNIIVVNIGSSIYIALSSVCTHQGATVGYNSTTGKIQCPRHGSVYETTGSNITGPATLPLKEYTTKLVGNILTITL